MSRLPRAPFPATLMPPAVCQRCGDLVLPSTHPVRLHHINALCARWSANPSTFCGTMSHYEAVPTCFQQPLDLDSA